CRRSCWLWRAASCCCDSASTPPGWSWGGQPPDWRSTSCGDAGSARARDDQLIDVRRVGVAGAPVTDLQRAGRGEESGQRCRQGEGLRRPGPTRGERVVPQERPGEI